MGPLTYQRIAVLAAITLIIHLLLGYTTFSSYNARRAGSILPYDKQSQPIPTRPHSDSPNAPPSASPGSTEQWQFDSARDAYHFGLTPEQCDVAFPGMWAELERSVAHRKKVGKITPVHVAIDWKIDGIVRAMIYDRQLFIIGARGVQRRDYRERSLAVLQSIQRAITAYPGYIPNIEFSFVVDDSAYFAVNEENTRATTWALTHAPKDTDKNLWLMPDFGYYSWEGVVGEYASVLRAIKDDEMPFEKKDKRAVWRGNKSPAGPVQVRDDLLKASENKTWADIEPINWGASPKNVIPMSKHCQYMFAVHTEGHTYSGRLKYLLNCHSVAVVHKLFWAENFHHLLVPSGSKQNFIQVERDFSDLDEKMEYYIRHPEEARRIADNSVKTFRDRYLTPAAQACYWRKLFHAWREVSFEPSFYEEGEGDAKEKNGDGTPKRKARGTPYETYVLIEAYEDSPFYTHEPPKEPPKEEPKEEPKEPKEG